MAKRNKRVVQEAEVVTRKEARLRARDRKKNRNILLGTGAAIGLALLIVIVGLVNEMVLKPNSALAAVEGQEIITRNFWERVKLEKGNLEGQLRQYQQLEQQFGGGQNSLFGSQINQIQAMLSSPFSLGVQVLDQMIEEKVIAIKAEELGVTVNDEEVEEALRQEVAAIQGALTEPQATSTAEAAVEATATAALFTPTPEPTLDASLGLTATATALPTPEPPPTRPLLNGTSYQEGLDLLRENLAEAAGMTLDEYKELIRARLLSEKMRERIGSEQVSPTEEQIHVRHILISVVEPAPEFETPAEETPSDEPATATPSPTATVTEESPEEPVAVPSPATTPVATATLQPPAEESPTAESTAEVESEPTPLPTPAELDDATALALAQELRQRILAGEDFATLAEEYSDDPGSAVDGGDLGWVGRGAFVPEFEEAAFGLAAGEISEPVKTDFGYHIIEVLERDSSRPKDENQIQQEEVQAFQQWLQEQMVSMEIQRPEDLSSKLPSDL